MVRRKLPQPTDGELAILRVLWDQGPSTVRQINEVLNQQQPTGYTTTLKMMQIMAEKELLVRDESARTHIYHARLAKEQTQSRLVQDLLERAFNGSAEQLVMRALSAQKVTPAELKRIRKMLDELKGK